MADKRPWFKHFGNAHDDEFLSRLISEKQVELFGYYWLIIEYISQRGANGVWVTTKKELCRKLAGSWPKVERILARLSPKIQARMDQDSSETWSIFCPKYLELQSSWGGKRQARQKQDPGSCPGEDRSKKIEDRNKNRNTYAQFAARLERVYEKFPRKEGKSRGLEKLRKVKESDLPLVEKAVENYAEHCSLNRTEPQYLKHFSTWATEWRDWVDFKPKVLAAKLEADVKAEEQRRRSEQLDKEIFGDGF
jgi:hypothetical protein